MQLQINKWGRRSIPDYAYAIIEPRWQGAQEDRAIYAARHLDHRLPVDALLEREYAACLSISGMMGVYQ